MEVEKKTKSGGKIQKFIGSGILLNLWFLWVYEDKNKKAKQISLLWFSSFALGFRLAFIIVFDIFMTLWKKMEKKERHLDSFYSLFLAIFFGLTMNWKSSNTQLFVWVIPFFLWIPLKEIPTRSKSQKLWHVSLHSVVIARHEKWQLNFSFTFHICQKYLFFFEREVFKL